MAASSSLFSFLVTSLRRLAEQKYVQQPKLTRMHDHMTWTIDAKIKKTNCRVKEAFSQRR
jgi:hypothetical protein